MDPRLWLKGSAVPKGEGILELGFLYGGELEKQILYESRGAKGGDCS